LTQTHTKNIKDSEKMTYMKHVTTFFLSCF